MNGDVVLSAISLFQEVDRKTNYKSLAILYVNLLNFVQKEVLQVALRIISYAAMLALAAMN